MSRKYQNPFFNSKYQNIGCIDADFCADFAIFLHFSRSTRIYWRKCFKMSKNAKILRTKFRKFSEHQQKTVIFWYFGCILYFGTLLDFCILDSLVLWKRQTSNNTRTEVGQYFGQIFGKGGQNLGQHFGYVFFQIRKRDLSQIMSEVCRNHCRGLPKLCPKFCPNFCRGLPKFFL